MNVKRYSIIGISILLLLLTSVFTYQYFQYKSQVKNIDAIYKEQLDFITDIFDQKKQQIESLKQELDVLNKSTLYGFFYNTKINKIVYIKKPISKENFSLDYAFNILSHENSTDIDNFYKNLKVNKSNFNSNNLVLDITISNWEKYSDTQKYNTITSLLWTLYTSTNLENVYLTIDGQPINFSGKKTVDIYNRYSFHQINDPKNLYVDTSINMLLPITYKVDDFYYVESNLTNLDNDLRTYIDKVSKDFNIPLYTVQLDFNATEEVLKVLITINDADYLIEPNGKDKEFIQSLREAFSLVSPYQTYVSLKVVDNGKEVGMIKEYPVFTTYNYLHKPEFNEAKQQGNRFDVEPPIRQPIEDFEDLDELEDSNESISN